MDIVGRACDSLLATRPSNHNEVAKAKKYCEELIVPSEAAFPLKSKPLSVYVHVHPKQKLIQSKLGKDRASQDYWDNMVHVEKAPAMTLFNANISALFIINGDWKHKEVRRGVRYSFPESSSF